MHESETNQKRDKFRDNRIRCKVLTQDHYTDRLFLIKSSKGYVKLPDGTLKTSLISQYSASLVFQNNLATSAGKKKKLRNADHSSIGQFYQHGLLFSYRFHNVHATLQLISTTFETKSYSSCWLSFSSVSIVFKISGVIFWDFSRTKVSASWARSASHSPSHLRGKI